MRQDQAQTIPAEPRPRGFAAALVFLLALALVMYAVRFASPWLMLGFDQPLSMGYILDLVHNGSWAVQLDIDGGIASKPPLYTWMVGLYTLISGEPTRMAVNYPGLVAWLGIAIPAFWVASRRMGVWVGVTAGAILLLSTFAMQHIHQARTDAIFGACVTMAACMAFLAWDRAVRGEPRVGLAWVAFWVFVALAILTKGPLGLLLAALGLGAIVWERRAARRDAQSDQTAKSAAVPDGSDAPEPHPPARSIFAPWQAHAAGVGIVLATAGGWFAAAWVSAGQPFIDKVIGDELVGHAVTNHEGALPLQNFYKVWFYYAVRFVPWSVLSLIAVWKVFKHPAADAGVRRLERFLVSWLMLGLLFYTVTPYIRGRMLIPLLAPGAILAAREAVALAMTWPVKVRWAVAIAILGASIGVHAFMAFGAAADSRGYQESMAADFAAADAIVGAGVDPSRLEFATGTVALQYRLGVMRPRIGPERAAELLASDRPAAVLLRLEDFRAAEGPWADLPADASEVFRTTGADGELVVVVNAAEESVVDLTRPGSGGVPERSSDR